MAFDDSFRERAVLEPEEVYKICRIKKRAEIYDLTGLSEPMADWVQKAHEVGATVVPRQIYTVQLFEQHEHKVGWFLHSRPEEDRVVDQHHIACDCVVSLENPMEEMDEILDCSAVVAALNHRAARVNEVLQTKGIFDFYGKPEGDTALKAHAIVTAKALINFVMNYEKAHPEGWIANTVSGEHQVPLLSAVMQIQPYLEDGATDVLSMQEVVEEMHSDGSLVLHDDGATVSLPKAA